MEGRSGLGKRIRLKNLLPVRGSILVSLWPTAIPMVSSQDHKRVYDGDKGPNTGGMGAFSPSPFYTADIAKYVEKNIIEPTIRGMGEEGSPFKGVLYFGLMLTSDGPKVLEYNARFGDPEIQAVLPRLKSDLLKYGGCYRGTTDQMQIDWDDRAAACAFYFRRISGSYDM